MVEQKTKNTILQKIRGVLFDPLIWAALVAALLFIGLCHFYDVGISIHLTANNVLFFVFVYPLLEEVVFRGWAQTSLLQLPFFARHFLGITLANVAISILFALAHLLRVEALFAPLYFFPSLIFGFFRDRHNSLVPAIALHAVYNLFWLVFL